MRLHRTIQGSAFLRECQKLRQHKNDNPNTNNRSRTNTSILTLLAPTLSKAQMKKVVFSLTEMNKPLPAPIKCLKVHNQAQRPTIATNQKCDHILSRE